MSLVECRECGSEVASTASTCPNCGIARPNRSYNWRIWALVLALLAAWQILPFFTDNWSPCYEPRLGLLSHFCAGP